VIEKERAPSGDGAPAPLVEQPGKVNSSGASAAPDITAPLRRVIEEGTREMRDLLIAAQKGTGR